ncbi:unnamed protein product [Cyprideis torosa]|uniref:Uncharacterized protein n=1 Tax=Cyprideis torosa TaxID=163714 RepID=A0A7R8ZNM5_9CRUS|nr:unnamed protein product [Cyprideis torosa]CAG0891961.1 unnamed protein product [Cyprideis torosa]
MSGVHQFQYHGKQGSPVPDDEKNAVLYIIVVLSFYSLGIVIMMVKYMKKHDRQMEDFNYQDYIQAQRNRMTQARWRPLNRLALSALNTANVIPQTVSKERRVTYLLTRNQRSEICYPGSSALFKMAHHSLKLLWGTWVVVYLLYLNFSHGIPASTSGDDPPVPLQPDPQPPQPLAPSNETDNCTEFGNNCMECLAKSCFFSYCEGTADICTKEKPNPTEACPSPFSGNPKECECGSSNTSHYDAHPTNIHHVKFYYNHYSSHHDHSGNDHLSNHYNHIHHNHHFDFYNHTDDLNSDDEYTGT